MSKIKFTVFLLILNLLIANNLFAQSVPPKYRVIDQGGVGLADGSFNYKIYDISVGPENDHQLRSIFSYNSRSGISNTLNTYITCECSSDFGLMDSFDNLIIVINGRSYNTGNLDSGVSYIKGSKEWIVLLRDGTRAYFPLANQFCSRGDSISRMFYICASKIVYPDGYAWNFEYNSDIGSLSNTPYTESMGINLVGGLKSAYTSQGYGLYFENNSVSMFKKFCSTETVICEKVVLYNFSYDANGNILTSTDYNGVVTTFSYDPDPEFPQYMRVMAKASRSDIGNLFENAYAYGQMALGWRSFVSSHKENGRGADIYSWERLPGSLPGTWEIFHIVNRAGEGRYKYNCGLDTQSCESTEDPFNRKWVKYFYQSGEIAMAKNPEGNSEENILSDVQNIARGNVILHKEAPKLASGIGVSSISYGYESCANSLLTLCCTSSMILTCHKPIYKIDERNNRTDYEYDSRNGNISSVIYPQNSDGLRNIEKYEYVSVNPIVNSYDSETGIVIPVYLIKKKILCSISSIITGVINFDYVCPYGYKTEIEYFYGEGDISRDLLLKYEIVTAGGSSLRTCYGYDSWGRQISKTQPRNADSVCPQ